MNNGNAIVPQLPPEKTQTARRMRRAVFVLGKGAVFTWFIDTQSDIRLKWIIRTARVMWGFCDFYYRNFVAFAFDVLTILSNFAAIII